MNATDLIAFWSRLGDRKVHPDDFQIDGKEFATNLHPVPWAGPLLSARVYFLFLNPGLSGNEEQFESTRADFQNWLTKNLKGKEPYPYLRPHFSDHPGYKWAKRTFGADQSHAVDDICVLQLVPYHSKRGDVARAVSRKLASSTVIKRFVHRELVPCAEAGEIGLVVARSSSLWGFKKISGVPTIEIYQGSQCRGALQTANTRGGMLLRRFTTRSPLAAGTTQD